MKMETARTLNSPDGVSVTLTIARSHESFCTSLTAYRWDGRDWDGVANDSEAGTETNDPISDFWSLWTG